MKKMKKIFIILALLTYQTNPFSDVPHFIDFKYILNQSDAGKKAQKTLKQNLDNGIKKLKEKEKNLQSEEKKIIEQKKIINPDEYKKKVNELRKKVSNLQKERNKILNDIAVKRSKARNELLKNLNPILQEYMQEKKIRIVLDKKNIFAGDEDLEITKDIMILLDKKLKSIKLN